MTTVMSYFVFYYNEPATGCKKHNQGALATLFSWMKNACLLRRGGLCECDRPPRDEHRLYVYVPGRPAHVKTQSSHPRSGHFDGKLFCSPINTFS